MYAKLNSSGAYGTKGNSYCGNQKTMVPTGKADSTTIVPTYGAISYSSLAKDPNNYSGYRQFNKAYGTTGCGVYEERSCC
jgi:hypothetical protein